MVLVIHFVILIHFVFVDIETVCVHVVTVLVVD